jgi:hypothetical protein
VTQEKWQEIRNKIYAVATVVLLLLVTLGWIDQARSDEAVNIVNIALQIAGEVITLYGMVLAWWKSRPSKVTTIELPSKVVSEVITTDSKVVAGPASASKTGTVLAEGDKLF